MSDDCAVEGVDGQTVGVQWSASSGATRYELQQTSLDSGQVKTQYNGPNTNTQITLSGPPDGVFRYAARACNNAGCSGWTQAPNNTWLQGGPIGNPRAVPATSEGDLP